MADTDMKEYVDLKLETAQAHNNAQFDIILQKLDSMQESMRSLRETMPTKWSMFATAASAVIAVIAIMAYGGDRFDSGMSTTTVSVQGVIDAKRDASEARAISAQNAEKLDTILDLLGEQKK